ncbi:hypothetical protein ACJRO7_030762 [Eucalyptus globulus]|uniref:Uncharacterized protein n=1 Tax=Eucalyptus globulus TaxID=34317 RepID=A0ABD3JI79_EUCGL
MVVTEERMAPSVEINGLSFTNPEIDEHLPPGFQPSSTTCRSCSIPAIAVFSLDPTAQALFSSNHAFFFQNVVLGGKHIVEPHMVRVLGRLAFHDTALTSSGDLYYLGGKWRPEVPFVGFEVPKQMDVSVEKMIFWVVGIYPQRRVELIKVSDEPRRRVQICTRVLKPIKITVDLKVLARADLLKLLRKECEQTGSIIIHATHIFYGLDDCKFTAPFTLVYVAHGKLQLAMTVESWLRRERDEERQRRKERKITGDPALVAARPLNNDRAGGRLHSTTTGEESCFFSSNRVLRQ